MEEAVAEAKELIDRHFITRELDLGPTETLMALEANWRARLTAGERAIARHLEGKGWTGSLTHHWIEPHDLTFRWSKKNENPADSNLYPTPSGLSEAFRQASRRTDQLGE